MDKETKSLVKDIFAMILCDIDKDTLGLSTITRKHIMENKMQILMEMYHLNEEE